MKKIAFRLHNPSGIVNQLMSLETAVAIQYLTGRQIDLHNIHFGHHYNVGYKMYSPRYFTQSAKINFIDDIGNPGLLDLFEIPNIERFNFIQPDFYEKYEGYNQIYLSKNYYMVDSEALDTDDEAEFSCGRSRLELDSNLEYSISDTLSYYSSFVYNKSSAFKDHISKVNFKKEYIDFAKVISNAIGDYTAIHFRITDHAYYSLSREEILKSIESAGNNKIVIFTSDEGSNLIKDIPKHCILFSSVVENYKKEFKDLTMSGDIVYDVVSLLALSMSKKLIGTQGSTYSGYATRYVKDYSYISIDNHISKYKYPWFDFPFPQGYKYVSWWREWPEYASIAQR